MKGATLKVTLEKPGITAPCTRPRVINDNPFSEALFRTCKYRPERPAKPATGNPPDPSGSIPKTKPACFDSETQHESGGQLI